MTGSAIDQFFAECLAGTEYVDARLALDAAVESARSSARLEAVRDGVDRLVDGAVDEVSARKALHRWVRDAEPPDGPSWRSWLLSVQAVVHNSVSDVASGTEPAHKEDLKLTHVSRFLDLETANRATTKVLRANEKQFRAWALDHAGWQRQHYYADLGERVGSVTTRRDKSPLDATSVAVVMAVDPSSGRPFILTSYPELPLDPLARQEFPDLCHWFGGYFGQDHEHPWSEARRANLQTAQPARERVRSQLDGLLAMADDELRQTLAALGSYVLPADSRAWVEVTRWRLGAYDWQAS